MSMMTLHIVKFVDSSKTGKSTYLENKKLFSIQLRNLFIIIQG